MANLSNAALSGFKIGAASGGSALGFTLKAIADKLRGDEQFNKDIALRRASFKPSQPSLLGVIAGIQRPEDVLTPEAIQGIAPRAVGFAEGGAVLAPQGSVFQNGQIISPQGQVIGEYTPGNEPKPFTPAIGNVLGKRFGVTSREAFRKLHGLPKETSPKVKNVSSVERKILSQIRVAKQQNIPIEDILQNIYLQGENPEKDIYRKELLDYNPVPKPKGFNLKDILSNLTGR